MCIRPVGLMLDVETPRRVNQHRRVNEDTTPATVQV